MMNTRIRVYIVLVTSVLIVVASSLYAWYNAPVMPFRPVRMDSHQQLQVHNEALTRMRADSVEGVLQRYHETYRRSDTNTVLITPSLYSDTELMWNYTSKAEGRHPPGQ